MQPEKESPAIPKKSPSLGHRCAGVFFGGVTGAVLFVILFLILNSSGMVSGYDRIFDRFALWGAIAGGIFGFIFPRPLIAIGSLIGLCLPGC